MTGLSAARIRKWQERYGLLSPRLAPNGYWYYSNEDFFKLRRIAESLKAGATISSLLAPGREPLVEEAPLHSDEELIRALKAGNFESLESLLSQRNKERFETWIERLGETIVSVGRIWEQGLISVADEHAFSFWFEGFFREKIRKLEKQGKPTCLVVSFPGDDHVLGALLHYGLLLKQQVKARFCGMLPVEALIQELRVGSYNSVHVSVVMPRKASALRNLKSRLETSFPDLKVQFGGPGKK